ncbi:MAG: hypothetical protein HUU21_13625, partial [Polyangiaceae bacterium]|nr:hypothetical protein [Polyangiaceae bacterium]
ASGDARSIGRLGRAFEGQGDASAAEAMYRLAAEIDDRSIEYPARLAIVLARAGRCEAAESAADDAEDRMAFYGLTDNDDLIIDAERSIDACVEHSIEPAD